MGKALDKYLDKNGLESEPKRVATVAIRHEGHALLGKRRDNGKWTTPGGHLEPGEDFRDGALREAKEEAGIYLEHHHLQKVGPAKTVEVKPGKKVTVQGFVAHLPERRPTTMTRDPDAEVERWRWVDVSRGLPDHIKDNLHVPLERNVLRGALGHHDEGEAMKGEALKKYVAKNKEKFKGIMPEHGNESEAEEDGETDEDDAEGDHQGKGHGTYKAPKKRAQGYGEKC